MTDTPVARYSDVAAALEQAPTDQPGRTIDLLARMLDLTDAEVCERTGRQISRATVNAKRKRRSPVRPEDLWPLADALGTTIDVLLLAPSEAARWLVEHQPERLDAWESPGGRQGELSNGVERSKCTGSLLYFQLYRSIMGGQGARAA